MRSRQDLEHVLWVGGGAGGGKSSVARALAEGHGLDLYCCDAAFERHRARVDAERHPNFFAIMNKWTDELWEPPPERQRDELVAFYREQLEMIVDDLRERPWPLVVEGVGVLPDAVVPSLASRRRVVLLLPTPAFRASLSPRHDSEVARLLEATKDPDRAHRNWLRRDELMTAWLRRRAAASGVRVIDNDGSRPLADLTSDVVRHFGL